MMDERGGILTPDNPQRQITNAELPERPKLKQVAAWLGMPYNRVRQMALEGAIPCKKIKRKKYNGYLFDKAALLEWAKPEEAA